MPRAYIGAIERGAANLGVINMTRLAHGLEIDVAALLASQHLRTRLSQADADRPA